LNNNTENFDVLIGENLASFSFENDIIMNHNVNNNNQLSCSRPSFIEFANSMMEIDVDQTQWSAILI